MANSTILQQAIRYGVVLKYLSQLSLQVALLSVVPFAVSLWFKDYRISSGFIVVFVCLLAIGIVGLRLPEADHIQANEGLVITALAFLVAPLLMTYPMIQGGLKFEDALFESISAITTTGLTTVENVEVLPPALLFLRSWMQWYGGLGIVVLSVALLLGHGMISRRLAESESPIENLVATTRTHARRMLGAYGVLTGIGIVGVWSMGIDIFQSTIHVLSAVSTGGFSSFRASLAGFGWWLPQTFIMTLAFCGALALPLYYSLHRKGLTLVMKDVEVRGLLIGATFTSLLLFVFLWQTGDFSVDMVGHAFLIGFSAQTGTGFTSLPIVELEPASKATLFGSMIVGGSIGSTAGGLKIWRFLIILGLIRFIIHRTSLPRHAVADIRIGERRVGEEEMHRTLILFALFIMGIFLSWLPFLVLGHNPLNALFEVISATATVGLSTDIAHPNLEQGLKFILCADMLLGRLEFIAFLVLIYPRTWFGKRAEVP